MSSMIAKAIGASSGSAGTWLGAGLLGAGASYASDGSMGKGAAMGLAAGVGSRSFMRSGAMKLGNSIMNASPGGSRRAIGGMKMGAFGLRASQSTSMQRAGMYAGAGLGGMMFGGNRNNHSTGFNARRGNRI